MCGSLALLGQLVWQVGWLDADQLVPSRRDAEVGATFVRHLEGMSGPVFSPVASWLPVQAGRQPSLHLIALWDINHEGGPYHEQVVNIEAALRNHRWPVAIESTPPVGFGLARSYKAIHTVHMAEGEFDPPSGWQAHPVSIVVPMTAAEAASRAH